MKQPTKPRKEKAAPASNQRGQEEETVANSYSGNGKVNSEILKHLREQLGPDTVFIPIPFGEKGPKLAAWQQITFKDTIMKYQAAITRALKRGGNLGVLLGEPSNGLIAIDIDDDAMADLFLPLQHDNKLAESFRSKGQRGFQIFARMYGYYPEYKTDVKLADGRKLCEWRGGGGHQSVVYGKHPSGCRYTILVDAPVVGIQFSEIVWPKDAILPWNKEPELTNGKLELETASAIQVAHNLDKRIKDYIDTVEPAISGEGGHSKTFGLACRIFHGYALTEEQVLEALCYYNQKCEPLWSEQELAHKAAEATQSTCNKPAGYLLNGDSGDIHIEVIKENDPAEKATNSDATNKDPSLETNDGTDEKPFPIEVLPATIRDLALSFSKTYGVPPETLVLPMISVISASLGQGLCAFDGNRRTYGNTFIYLDIKTGGFKSEAFSEAMRPVAEFNKQQEEKYKNELAPKAKAELSIINQKVEYIKNDQRKPALSKKGSTLREFTEKEARKRLAELEQAKQVQETSLKFWTVQSSDATVEALARKGAALGKLFIATDEASIVQGIVCGKYSEQFTNEGFFCKIYSGTPYERERIKDNESVYATAIFGTMLLMGQPHITAKMFQDENMKISGYIPRFLLASIPCELKENYSEVIPIDDKAREAYRCLVAQLLDKYWLRGGEPEQIEFKKYTPTPSFEPYALEHGLSPSLLNHSALEYLNNFQGYFIRAYGNRIDGVDGVIARLREQAIRLAVVFHAAKFWEATTEKDIDDATVRSAIAVVAWCFDQYLAYNESIHSQKLNEIEGDILAFAKRAVDKGVSAREVRSNFKSRLGTVDKADQILNKLAEKGKLVVTDIPPPTGGRVSRRYTWKRPLK